MKTLFIILFFGRIYREDSWKRDLPRKTLEGWIFLKSQNLKGSLGHIQIYREEILGV
jgi:hypothetical protein